MQIPLLIPTDFVVLYYSSKFTLVSFMLKTERVLIPVEIAAPNGYHQRLELRVQKSSDECSALKEIPFLEQYTTQHAIVQVYCVVIPNSLDAMVRVGRKEKEEAKILYFYPQSTILVEQLKFCGFFEAIVSFATGFSSQFGGHCESVHLEKHRYAFYDPEEQFMLVMILHGELTSRTNDNLRVTLQSFFNHSLSTLDFRSLTCFDHLCGMDVSILSTSSALCAATVTSQIESLLPFVSRIVIFFKQQLVYSELGMNDTFALWVMLFGKMMRKEERKIVVNIRNRMQSDDEEEDDESTTGNEEDQQKKDKETENMKLNEKINGEITKESENEQSSLLLDPSHDNLSFVMLCEVPHITLEQQLDSKAREERKRWRIKKKKELEEKKKNKRDELDRKKQKEENEINSKNGKDKREDKITGTFDDNETDTEEDFNEQQKVQLDKKEEEQKNEEINKQNKQEENIDIEQQDEDNKKCNEEKEDLDETEDDDDIIWNEEEQFDTVPELPLLSPDDLQIMSQILSDLASTSAPFFAFDAGKDKILDNASQGQSNSPSPSSSPSSSTYPSQISSLQTTGCDPLAREVIVRMWHGIWIGGRRVGERQIVAVFPRGSVNNIAQASNKLTEIFEQLKQAYL
ncbi:MAG: hypothetical protein EZS28_001683 [Streblomastix strix]|uniref:CCZ1/INTU/HSP4 first Longin domain-containing protein n=1 Tax=Streblomastix strix TaxID=222440 RepID=A0A5J4X6X3_9EUKA|nr:MAG: hypothetical protein EZS28_001683 [Streblomastix strix]